MLIKNVGFNRLMELVCSEPSIFNVKCVSFFLITKYRLLYGGSKLPLIFSSHEIKISFFNVCSLGGFYFRDYLPNLRPKFVRKTIIGNWFVICNEFPEQTKTLPEICVDEQPTSSLIVVLIPSRTHGRFWNQSFGSLFALSAIHESVGLCG